MQPSPSRKTPAWKSAWKSANNRNVNPPRRFAAPFFAFVCALYGGTAIVRDTHVSPLRLDVGTDPAQTVRVVWAADSYPAGVTGSAGGLVSGANDVIPRYRSGLANVAQQLADILRE